MSLADKVLLWPPRAGAANSSHRELVSTPQGAIEAFVARSDHAREPSAFLLRFYGNADLANGRIAAETARFRRVSIEAWGVNYLGYGRSEGIPTLRGVSLSAISAYDALSRRAGNRPVIVIGTSLGAAAALHVSARRQVAGVVLYNPPPLRELILGRHGWWNLWLLARPVARQVPDDLDSIANAASSTAPGVFVMCLRDQLVPIGYQRRIVDAYGGPKRILVARDAGHTSPIPQEICVQVQTAIEALIDRT